MTDEQDRKLDSESPEEAPAPPPPPAPPDVSMFDQLLDDDEELDDVDSQGSSEQAPAPLAKLANFETDSVDETWDDDSTEHTDSSSTAADTISKKQDVPTDIALRVPNDLTPPPPGIKPSRSSSAGDEQPKPAEEAASKASTGVRAVPVITLGVRQPSAPPTSASNELLSDDVEEVIEKQESAPQIPQAPAPPKISDEEDDDDEELDDDELEVDSEPPIALPARDIPVAVVKQNGVPARQASPAPPMTRPLSPSASAPPPPPIATTPAGGTRLPSSPSASAPPPPVSPASAGSIKIPAAPATPKTDSPSAPPAASSQDVSSTDDWEEPTLVKKPAQAPSAPNDTTSSPDQAKSLVSDPTSDTPELAANLAGRAGVAFMSSPEGDALAEAAKQAQSMVKAEAQPQPKPPPPAAPPPPPPEPKPAARPAKPAPPRKEKRRGRPVWEVMFSDDFVRALRTLSDSRVKKEVDFIEQSLKVKRGGVVLDLGCGMGQHAIEMAARGFNVVGYDLSITMLANASDLAQEKNVKLNLLQGDMREMGFEDMFDGIYCWDTTFGMFDEDRNISVIQKIHRALRKGGTFLLDIINRDFVCSQLPSLVWFEGDGAVCIDDAHFDSIASRLRVKRTLMLDDGSSKEIEYSVRLYSLHEIGRILHDAGFQVGQVSGNIASPGAFFGASAPRIIVRSRKR